jgi:signal transduction histidine kinase
MTDRIGALGGELRLDSTPGRGTTVTGNIPLQS